MDYDGKTRKAIQGATESGTNAASTGPTKTVAGNPHTGMGVKSGKSVGAVAGDGGQAGVSAGRSRTNRGKNSTGSGPQGLRG